MEDITQSIFLCCCSAIWKFTSDHFNEKNSSNFSPLSLIPLNSCQPCYLFGTPCAITGFEFSSSKLLNYIMLIFLEWVVFEIESLFSIAEHSGGSYARRFLLDKIVFLLYLHGQGVNLHDVAHFCSQTLYWVFPIALYFFQTVLVQNLI